jgi:hypothetical protein
MKRFILSSLSVLIVFLSQAQIKKGQVLLGGSLGFGQSSTTFDSSFQQPGNKLTTFNISPSVGWAIKDNLLFGVEAVYTHQRQGTTQTTDDAYTVFNSFTGGVFLRKYKYLGSGFSFFAQSSFDLTYGHTKYFNNSSTHQNQDNIGFGIGFFPGVAFTLSSRWQIETGFPNLGYVNYSHTKYTVEQPNSPNRHSTTNNFSIGSSLSNTYQLSIGLRYLIG